MSVWDDPELQGDRIRFEEIGDRVRGRITKIEPVKFQNSAGVKMELAEVVARQNGVPSQRGHSSVTATQSQLVPQLFRNKVDVGHVVDIELIGLSPTGGGFTRKDFKVDVQKPSAAPVSAPTSTPAEAEQGDLFG